MAFGTNKADSCSVPGPLRVRCPVIVSDRDRGLENLLSRGARIDDIRNHIHVAGRGHPHLARQGRGWPSSSFCNHIDAAQRVAVGVARHAFLALHTLWCVTVAVLPLCTLAGCWDGWFIPRRKKKHWMRLTSGRIWSIRSESFKRHLSIHPS